MKAFRTIEHGRGMFLQEPTTHNCESFDVRSIKVIPFEFIQHSTTSLTD